jgi:hypothetical protein
LVAFAFLTIGPHGVREIAAQTKRVTCESIGGGYNYCRVDTDNKVRLERKLSASQCVYGSSWGYDNRGIWVDRGCRAEFGYGGTSAGSVAAAGAIIGGILLAGALANRNRNDSTSNYSQDDVYNLGYRDGHSDGVSGKSNSPNPNRYRFENRYNDVYRNGYEAGYGSARNNNEEDAYRNGYNRGAQDARANYYSDYRRYRSDYSSRSESDFKRGYAAGFADNRNSWGNSGGGYDTVPSFFVGTFRGWTEANVSWTDMIIHSDGSIRLRAQNGDTGNGYFRNGAAVFPWGSFRLRRDGNGFTAVDPNNRNASVYYSRVR